MSKIIFRDKRGRRLVPKGYGRYLSDCPVGHDTVLGYLAKNRRDMLDLMDIETPSVTLRDGFWLTRHAARAGYQPIKVRAAKVLRRQGIPVVNSYPVHLLERRFD